MIRPPADPNAACPCGSGRKYKNCHGRPAGGLKHLVAVPLWGLVAMLVAGGAAGWLLHAATRGEEPGGRIVSAPRGSTLPSPGAASAAAPEPSPYAYDPRTNKHWDPNHHHWHNGLPPSRATGDTGAPARASVIAGASPPPAVAGGAIPEPSPWFYDPATQRHWDPRHKHWHNGQAPSPEQRAILMAASRRDTSHAPTAAPASAAPAADTATGGGP